MYMYMEKTHDFESKRGIGGLNDRVHQQKGRDRENVECKLKIDLEGHLLAVNSQEKIDSMQKIINWLFKGGKTSNVPKNFI